MDCKLYAVRIWVTDWEKAVAFYQHTLGLKLEFEERQTGWAQFDVGGCYLGIERVDPGDEESKSLVGRFVGASLSVENIDAAYGQLKSKDVEFLGPPDKQPWGGVLAHFKDPDGNVLTLLGMG